jgi:hypothetical protein
MTAISGPALDFISEPTQILPFQIHQQVKLQPVIVWFHIFAALIKRFVVIAFLEMGHFTAGQPLSGQAKTS